jgi:tripartite-type tricarboxylate transporter receptor subunit TctC
MTRTIRAALAAVLSLTCGAALAAFPDKPVRLVVPQPAGGPTDIVVRIVAEALQKTWAQPVIVENRAGASGAIGTDAVLKSAADGYTLLAHSPIMLATELNRPSVGYRTLRDFVPVSTVFTTGVIFCASNTSTQGGLKEILAWGAAHPGQLSYGSHGEGTSTHYFGERLSRDSKVPMNHVPFAGEAPILTALMGGHVQTGFVSGLGAKKVAESGRARMVAIASPTRSKIAPEVPTFQELGLEGFDRTSWVMLLAPAGAPDAVVKQIAKAVDDVVKKPDVQKRFLELGVEPAGGTPADALNRLQGDYAYWNKLIKEFGVLAK